MLAILSTDDWKRNCLPLTRGFAMRLAMRSLTVMLAVERSFFSGFGCALDEAAWRMDRRVEAPLPLPSLRELVDWPLAISAGRGAEVGEGEKGGKVELVGIGRGRTGV